ncbi:MAG: hypothetical protein ACRDYY_13050 [Acidimicrobiales bacterium]
MIAISSVVLSNLAYLIGVVVLAVIGGGAVWLRHRRPTSVDANVETFHRGLRALAPDRSNGAPARVPAGVIVSGRFPGPRPAAPTEGEAPGAGAEGEAAPTEAVREEGQGG